MSGFITYHVRPEPVEGLPSSSTLEKKREGPSTALQALRRAFDKLSPNGVR